MSPTDPVVLFAGDPELRADYREPLAAALAQAGISARVAMDPDEADPAEVAYMVFAANGPVKDFTPYTGLRLLQGLWAGADAVLKLPLPKHVPYCRMVEPGLTEGMIDYVVGHVMRHHIDIDRWIPGDYVAEWERDMPPLARDRRVAVLGIGALGAACADKLAGLGFQVHGWSRTPKTLPGITCHAGAEGLAAVLPLAEILVLLLPHTPETARLINAERLAMLPESACLINAGRGELIDHDALLAALDAGRLRHATMDVFDEEPLPRDHPYWRHPRATVTPHIAAATRPATACDVIAAQIARVARGDAPLHVVDRRAGY